jgi:hypothetical protein
MPSTTDAETTKPRSEHRLRVVGDRVVCRRIGPTDLERCIECAYLLRLGRRYVVCVEGDLPIEPEFAW